MGMAISKVIIASAILIPSLLFYGCHNDFYLHIIDPRSKAIVERFSLKEGEEFTVKFIHSVVKEPVHESFYIDSGGRIILKEVEFRKICVGYGKHIPTLFPLMERDGWHYMRPNVKVQAPLRYRVGYVAEHTLVIKGRDYPFSEWMEPGEALEIVAEKISSHSKD